MGNSHDKTHGGRGQALGSAYEPPPKATNKSKKKKKSKKQKKRPPPAAIYHSQAEQRAARSKLVQNKQINVQSELNKKEKMLHIMNAADALSQGQRAPDAPQSMQMESQSNPKTTKTATKPANSPSNPNLTSIYMADPSSKQALAAEMRIQQKQSKKAKNSEERKNRTRDLLFGDALKIRDDDIEDANTNINKHTNKSAQFPKSDRVVPLSSVSNIASPSRQVLAAEKRIQQKQSKKIKNSEQRKNRTRDLLFGDALEVRDDDVEDTDKNTNINTNKTTNKSAQFYKSDRDVPLSSDSKIAGAALARLDKQKNNRIINQKDRKQRTMKLMHGDLLQAEDEVKAAPRQSAYDEDMDPEIVAVHQSVLNLNNCNKHEKMPATAKLLRKVITNLLGAETRADQEKFGKLRLSNKKIKAAFVDMEYGVETLESLGFYQKKIYNDKEHKMDDYMVFDFVNVNHKGLIHVVDLLNEYYPEQ